MSTRTRLAESVIASREAYREGYAAEDCGKALNACPYDFGWQRTAWERGWKASEKARQWASD